MTAAQHSTLLDQFDREFAPFFADDPRKRWPCFRRIAARLLGFDRPVTILEAGTARTEGNWSGDGQSTLLWDFILGLVGGHCESVDTNPTAVNVACEQMRHGTMVRWGDDYSFLHATNPEVLGRCDLLYLDSYDSDPGHEAMAALHHVGVLAGVYEELPSGCMIAVDDCGAPFWGKDTLIRAFFDGLHVAPIVNGYITVWSKP